MTTTQPVVHKRGQTFSYLMKIPDTISDGFMFSWKPTAQLRKARNSSPSGLIAMVNCSWADTKARTLLLHHNQTQEWPLGLAELDVKFESITGQVLKSNTLTFEIVPGVSK